MQTFPCGQTDMWATLNIPVTPHTLPCGQGSHRRSTGCNHLHKVPANAEQERLHAQKVLSVLRLSGDHLPVGHAKHDAVAATS